MWKIEGTNPTNWRFWRIHSVFGKLLFRTCPLHARCMEVSFYKRPLPFGPSANVLPRSGPRYWRSCCQELRPNMDASCLPVWLLQGVF